MSKNFGKNENSLDIEQEYEDINSPESINTNDSHHAVHFVLNERLDESTIQRSTPFSIPIIRINDSTDSRSITPPNATVDDTMVQTDQLNGAVGILHLKVPQTNISDMRTRIPGSAAANIALYKEPTFEENTGGLTQETVADTAHTLFFNDGERRIDMVLVYNETTAEEDPQKIEHRKTFEENLRREGLELETENKEKSFDGQTCFVKIHCPYNVLKKHAFKLSLKRPVKSLISVSVDAWKGKKEVSFEREGVCFPLTQIFDITNPLVEDDPTLHTSVFTSYSDQDKLLVKDRQKFYTSSQRSHIVWQILLRTRFSTDNGISIRKLLNCGTYLAAFPLHEGSHSEDEKSSYIYDRRLLYLIWAKPTNWYKQQPLWLIRKYFGDKIALYFAWLGFYTNMLILPSIVGLGCFIYGLSRMDSMENTPSREICDPKISGNITLCPLCDSCKYRKLGESCLFSKLSFLFDNNSTVFFAMFMSFWAALFLELWKRKQALITWQWDLFNATIDEDTRPEYDLQCSSYRINPVTRQKEPFASGWEKLIKYTISAITCLFMVFLVLLFLFLTIILRISIYPYISDSNINILKRHSKIITSIIAALVNLLAIIVLTRLHHNVALWSTNNENPRTKAQYEKSLIVKIFFFEFMNYYVSLIYIAFLKGRFFSYPGDNHDSNSILLKLQRDVCDPAGCLSELCVQLAIIMVGKQCFNNILEYLVPAVHNWWRSRMMDARKSTKRQLNHWEMNFAMQDPGILGLFEEYLEMVIQYGFVTLFVAAFPLAPLFALLNNIFEIRLDAFKLVAQSRRPIAERVDNIGAWFSMLRAITYCAVVFNAFVIAYTSDYIPRIVYQYFYSENNTLEGYIDSSLSVFNTSDYVMRKHTVGGSVEEVPETCQYRGYRTGPDDSNPYDLSIQYFIITAARLLFVVIFEHFVFSVSEVISGCIPDVPYLVDRQVQLEKLLIDEHERRRQENNSDHPMDDYDKFLNDLRDAQDSDKFEEVVNKNTWVRRISRRISENGIIAKIRENAAQKHKEGTNNKHQA